MSEYVKPYKLRLIKDEIIQDHKDSITIWTTKENYLKDLVTKVVSWDRARVIGFGELLTEEDIYNLACYIPSNRFKVNLTNLFILMNHLANKNDWDIIFLGWQRFFDRNEVKKFLFDTLQKNKFAKEMLADRKISFSNLSWMQFDNVVDYLCSLLGNVSNLDLFKLKLQNNGVIKDTNLYLSCLDSFLLYCHKDVYLELGDREIAHAYSGYTENKRNLFYKNFLMKNNLNDLSKFKNVYYRISSSLKNEKVRKNFLELLEQIDEKLPVKYMYWENMMELELAFKGDPERLNFWKKYAIGYKVYNYNSNMLYIDFGKYVVTERKGKAAGPAYFYSKKYFREVIEWKLRTWSWTKFKDFQLTDFKKNGEDKGIERWPHQPSYTWAYDFKRSLEKHGIYQQKYN